MKIFKKALMPNVLFLLLLVFSSCGNNDDESAPIDVVSFDNILLNGNNEVPPNSSTATGMFSGTYNPSTKILTYSITFNSLTPTAMHFHKGAIGANGGVEIGIGSPPYSSPVNAATTALTSEQEADLLAGNWYVNIHTAEIPAGEIRGQLVQ